MIASRITVAILLSSSLAMAEPTWRPPTKVYAANGSEEVCSRDRRGQWHAIDDDWQRCIEALVRNMEDQFRLVAKLVISLGRGRR